MRNDRVLRGRGCCADRDIALATLAMSPSRAELRVLKDAAGEMSAGRLIPVPSPDDDAAQPWRAVESVLYQVGYLLPDSQVVSVPPETVAREALSLMKRRGYSQLPVLQGMPGCLLAPIVCRRSARVGGASGAAYAPKSSRSWTFWRI